MVDQEGNMQLAETFGLHGLVQAFDFSTSRMAYYYDYYRQNTSLVIDFTLDWKHYLHALDMNCDDAIERND